MIDSAARLQAALADRFRIERELGRGGMATVYLASDLRQERTIALKVIRPEVAPPLGSSRFLPEIKLTASPNGMRILFDREAPKGGDLWSIEGTR